MHLSERLSLTTICVVRKGEGGVIVFACEPFIIPDNMGLTTQNTLQNQSTWEIVGNANYTLSTYYTLSRPI